MHLYRLFCNTAKKSNILAVRKIVHSGGMIANLIAGLGLFLVFNLKWGQSSKIRDGRKKIPSGRREILDLLSIFQCKEGSFMFDFLVSCS
jgi:hypothetical protein